MGAPVTESPTFPMIFPAAAAAGVAGTKRARSIARVTSVAVTARRKSVEFIRIPPQESAALAAQMGANAKFLGELYGHEVARPTNCTSLVERQAFDRAIGRFIFAGAGELVHDAAHDHDAPPRSSGRRGWERGPESGLRIPDLDIRERRELVHAQRQSS